MLFRSRKRTSIRLIQLIDDQGHPADFPRASDRRSYRELVTPAGLREIATYADGIGVHKRLVIPSTPGGATLGAPTSLVPDAHAAGLKVHVWTLRSDPPFLAPDYADDPAAEWRQFAALGVDGIFGDFPDVGVKALRSK